MGIYMQFNLYIFNQLLRTTLALTSVLVGIIWLFQTIRILELVVNRGAPVSDFLIMSVASMPLWLMIAIPISGFIAVNWVYSRILADRELLVMQSIGLSPLQLAKAPIALGILLTGFLAVNSVYILPASFGVYKDLQFKLRNSIPTILLRDGVFIEVVDDMTMFIGSRDDDDVMRDLFIHDARLGDRIITMTAKSGTFIERDGSPTLILQNGQRSERNAEGQSGAVLLFETHSVTITRSSSQPTARATIDINEDTIANLLSPAAASSPQYYLQRHAEGHYRIASPWLGLGLALLSAAIILRGQIRRDLWTRRASMNIGACVLVIIAVVVTRGWVTNNASLWPFIHLSVFVPIILAIWLLRSTQIDSSSPLHEGATI
ncbi:MAG: LptF/LptG family permease [Alphaproteobacteria bacterium]|nr:LptF/LptG family permease [Alphaproteobacteria bacterium]